MALQNSNPKVTECFNVESRILCMTYVPLDDSLENGEGSSDERKAIDTPTVCLGMEEGRCVHHQHYSYKKTFCYHELFDHPLMMKMQ